MKAKQNVPIAVAVVLACLTICNTPAQADPCGMVPPIYFNPQTVPITRVGLQKTYVFYQDGLETLVIRPGFEGKVEEFGMLIPFPTPPAIRKVADDIFPHIAAAIDPPEVVIDLRWQMQSRLRRFSLQADVAAGLAVEEAKDEVRVIREEAVGMYEVVVLDAGSARALKRWMDDHEYRYPEGMDAACDDYVEAGWCFVAVRTQVGHKSKVDPQPGQKEVDTRLALGASFDGHVQAMGFRFRTDKLVVPMRLSTFNEGDLHNVVYVLTDRPSRINHVPEKYVVRQVEGAELLDNVTGPLPLRILGGTAQNILPPQRESLKLQRNPEPHNGLARELFAGDLVCAHDGRLAIGYEETEKELLRIGELLNMRGPEVDVLHREVLREEREESTEHALATLEDMTLTVIDGDFPRDVLSRDNLHFSKHEMSKERNTAAAYDARLFGPAPQQGGTVIRDSIATIIDGKALPSGTAMLRRVSRLLDTDADEPARFLWIPIVLVGAVVFVGVRRRWARGTWLMLVAGLLIVTAYVSSTRAEAPAGSSKLDAPLLEQFQDPSKREQAIVDLQELGDPALDALVREVRDSAEMTERGWAVACLGELKGQGVVVRLHELANDGSLPTLVRSWCMAALYKQATSVEQLAEYARGPMPLGHAELHRPFQIRLSELLAEEEATDLSQLLELSSSYPFLNAMVIPSIREHGAQAIVRELLTNSKMQVRSQAAAVLGAIGTKPEDQASIAQLVLGSLAFTTDSETVPWHGGPLFLPGITWKAEDGEQAIEHLLSWWMWCEQRELQGEISVIANNLWVFSQAASVTNQASLDLWLFDWGRRIGSEKLEQKIKQSGGSDKQRLVDQLRAIEAASETAKIKQNGQWIDVRVAQREQLRTEVVHLTPQLSHKQWLPTTQVVSQLSDVESLKKASVGGKYSGLLHVVRAEDDFDSYGTFKDTGYWSGTAYAGHQNLNPGHWVYVFPNWYVWKSK